MGTKLVQETVTKNEFTEHTAIQVADMNKYMS